MEFEIYAYNGELPTELTHQSLGLEPGIPEIEEQETVDITPPTKEQEFLKGVYVEVWMMDLAGWIKSNPRNNLSQWPSYNSMISKLKNMSANFVWLMPCRSGFINNTYNGDWYNSEVLWPSDYIEMSSPQNYLQTISETLENDSIELFVGERPYPGWKPKPNITEYDMFVGGIKEIAQSGAHGVSLCYDESCNFPSIWGDSIEMGAEGGEQAKSLNPNITTITNLQIYKYRSWGFPDFGVMADMDLLGTEGYFTMDDPYGHWHPAISTKRMKGANPKKGSIITQNTPWTSADNTLFYETFPPVSMYGATLSSIMHGGDAMAYWRLMYQNDDYHKHTKTGYEMLDILSSWGGKQAEVPKKILILHSYKSTSIYARPQGWAYYAIVYLKNFPDYPLEEVRGFASEEAVMEFLLKNGYPFHYQISDYGDNVENLTDYNTIIIPFAYWINSSTLPKIEQAVNNGTKLIIMGNPKTHQNLVDNRNNSVKSTISPSFDYLINHNNTHVITEDILHGITPELETQLLNKLNENLGEEKPTYMNNYGKDIELGILEKNETEKFLFIILCLFRSCSCRLVFLHLSFRLVC
jgi:hypothetical protein